jgi:23S rRNA pseudouridine2457 synthase
MCLSQFTREGDLACLKDFFDVPSDVYPVGRLDSDSEGLLLLTNDPSVNHVLLNPKFSHQKKYFAQVEGTISEEQLDKLRRGVEISVNAKKYKTLPCRAEKIPVPALPERFPPVRFRKNIPTDWLSLCISEGKNRQVRKMTASVGLPTLRLIRIEIENLHLGEMSPGEMKEWGKKEFFERLRLKFT